MLTVENKKILSQSLKEQQTTESTQNELRNKIAQFFQITIHFYPLHLQWENTCLSEFQRIDRVFF